MSSIFILSISPCINWEPTQDGGTFGVHIELPPRNLREHSFEALVGGAVPPEEYYGNDAGVPIRRGSGAGLYYCPLLVTPTNTCAN